MRSILDIAESAGVTVTMHANTELIAIEDAERFVHALERHGLIILGFDGFFLDDPYIIPDMDMIADFSSLYREADAAQRSVAAAIRILRSAGKPGHYFDFVVATEDERQRDIESDKPFDPSGLS